MNAQTIPVVTIDDAAADQFPTDICAVDDVVPGDIYQAVLASGHKLAIYSVEGAIYVTDDLCSHGEASLSEDGLLEGTQVECSWHFGRFDVRTGEACAMPCTLPLRTWEVEVRNGRVWVTGLRRPTGVSK